jgi:hypothetical protein
MPLDCLGIMAGLGRGAPGTPPGRGARKSVARSPGRSPRPVGGLVGTSPGTGRRVRCMPWVEEKGLLPGRGPVGRGARGPGVGALGVGLVARAAGAAGATGGGVSAGGGVEVSAVAGAPPSVDSGRGGASVTGVGLPLTAGGASGVCAAGAVTPLPVALTGAVAAVLAAFFAALASAAAFQASPRCSVRRRTTGGSTVEEADLTNSPMSLSAVSTSLLGTPNSLASSWTRTFATVLLLGGPSR